MLAENFLKLTDEEVKKPIYRIFARRWFIDALTKRRLTLMRPKIWEDPYENYFIKFLLKNYGRQEEFLISRGENMFGLCWTLHRETDAIWRIYSSQKDGIKVKSSITKLYEVLSTKMGILAQGNCFVGKVEYQGKKKIQKFLLSPDYLDMAHHDNSSRFLASSLLLKRSEFSHEKEVRILFSCQDKNLIRENDFFDIEIEPNDIFESIVIDPRVGYSEFLKIKAELKELGYRNSIYRSRLYSLDFGENDSISKTLKSKQRRK